MSKPSSGRRVVSKSRKFQNSTMKHWQISYRLTLQQWMLCPVLPVEMPSYLDRRVVRGREGPMFS